MKHLITSLLLALSLNASEYNWSFQNHNNPSYSETDSPVGLSILSGPFGTGWTDHLPFSTSQGFWDLGSSGTMTGTVSDGNTLTTVETVEWFDGGIYGTFSDLSISGTSLSSESFEIEEVGPVIGNWIKHTRTYSVPPVWTLTLTGSTNGTIIDRMTIKTYQPDKVYGLWVESSDYVTGPWMNVTTRPLLLVTNRPGSLFYRVKLLSP